MQIKHGVFFREMAAPDKADVLLMGVPFDGTVSGRPGARYGPDAIRTSTLNIEDYSPYLDRDISDLLIYDHGDIELPVGDTEQCMSVIEEEYSSISGPERKCIVLGGEHLITYPLVKVMHKTFGEDLFIIHFDAHADLRDDYLGVELSHATVMKHVSSLLGNEKSAVIGVRSGTREEWAILNKRDFVFGGASSKKLDDFKKFAENQLIDKKVYITVDLDVFDPGIMPGTGTPQPGGINFPDFMDVLKSIPEKSIVSGDIVELAPGLDSSGISGFLAATVLREMILIMGGNR